ncbi:ABC transporter permease MalE [Chloropicon roscoffensis]|uniref:ABC transporter permease MalE n=2 Tax=Chloropicon roscoffensis TaxID=1461544 RepID=A0AAX4P477_9CHLO|mmetsp:Transcript_4793/g.16780  ORF Transcript_4793/g.16780 Transcript_4793/m.16780 type:complete len:360 (-) Transcript_4793:967-2046(-)
MRPKGGGLARVAAGPSVAGPHRRGRLTTPARDELRERLAPLFASFGEGSPGRARGRARSDFEVIAASVSSPVLGRRASERRVAATAFARGSSSEADTGNVNIPKWLLRSCFAMVTVGQVVVKTFRGKVHLRNVLEQLSNVGPKSLSVCLLTSCFVGMVFTIQFTREFARLGLTKAVGGVLALALSRELVPVITAVIMAGRIGSAYAAELGTMRVSEQIDSLRMLSTDPVDYLVTPRVIACAIALPLLAILCFAMGISASVLLADLVYDVGPNVILDSASKALQKSDIFALILKSVVFGAIISSVSCSWGMTTQGGAKGVGESTTSAVVISLVAIFIADFFLSFAIFQGASSESIKACMV